MKSSAIVLVSTALMLSACGTGPEKASGPQNAAAALSAPTDNVSDPATATLKPSFDCAKAASEAEKLVCSDPALAAFDNELARVFVLAQADSFLTPKGRDELQTLQRGWVKGRDDCWKADDKKQCVVENYAMRIHRLRQGSVNARKPDAAGVSVGPLTLACKNLNALAGVTFYTVEPGYAFVEYLDKQITFAAVPKVPEARYAGKTFEGSYGLVTEGNAARLTVPGQPEMTCDVEATG